jgi:hypothetical protein
VILWVPLIALLTAVVAECIANSCATLAIYDSWAAFGARLGISILWLVLLSFELVKLSQTAHKPQHEVAIREEV